MKKITLVSLTSLLPFLASAEALSGAAKAVNAISLALNKKLIPFLILLALAYFLFGVVTYIGEREDAKREEKKQKMFWGLIALFVMLSVWSLVFVISETFNIDTKSKNGSFYDSYGEGNIQKNNN